MIKLYNISSLFQQSVQLLSVQRKYTESHETHERAQLQ
jgi:hypothetical protein